MLSDLLTRRREPAAPNRELDLWEPTLQDHVPDGLCDLYVVVLSSQDILGWSPVSFETGFQNGKSILDFGNVEVDVRKKGIATGFCFVGVVDGQAGVWHGPHSFNDGEVKVRRWDTVSVQATIMLHS